MEVIGDFIYDVDGFSCIFNDIRKFYKWNDIEKIIAYKIDFLAVDEVCLELFFSNFTLLFTEETNGWEGFINKMHQNFPQINQNWRVEIVKPAFARNETILFQTSLQL